MSAPLPPSQGPALVSACLLGVRCTFDERLNLSERTTSLARSRPTLALCPEELAGFSTPRPAAHLSADGAEILDGHGQVTLDDGTDVTQRFLDAAHEVLRLCQEQGIREAWLKSKSPSCGLGPLKIGGERSIGAGVTAALLQRHGITVHSVDADPRVDPAAPPAGSGFEV